MDQLSLKIDKRKMLIEEEKEKYNRAITHNKELGEAKIIYLKIKSLERNRTINST